MQDIPNFRHEQATVAQVFDPILHLQQITFGMSDEAIGMSVGTGMNLFYF